jgi:hypothetical protein
MSSKLELIRHLVKSSPMMAAAQKHKQPAVVFFATSDAFLTGKVFC